MRLVRIAARQMAASMALVELVESTELKDIPRRKYVVQPAATIKRYMSLTVSLLMTRMRHSLPPAPEQFHSESIREFSGQESWQRLFRSRRRARSWFFSMAVVCQPAQRR